MRSAARKAVPPLSAMSASAGWTAKAGAGRQRGVGIDQAADELGVQAGDEHQGRGGDRKQIGERRRLLVGQRGAGHGGEPDQLGDADGDHLQRHEQQAGDEPDQQAAGELAEEYAEQGRGRRHRRAAA